MVRFLGVLNPLVDKGAEALENLNARGFEVLPDFRGWAETAGELASRAGNSRTGSTAEALGPGALLARFRAGGG